MSAPFVAVAYSGGRDSTALLHATLTEAKALGIRVLALHVHHGLSPNADAWLAHCDAQCGRWARRGAPVDFVAHRLVDRPLAGDSVEAWARDARYDALGRMAREGGASAVLLAHHRRDQAETFLLQALRGAGVAGLCAMPARVLRDGLTWLRPWLDRSSDEIDAYARGHRLSFVVDEGNGDLRFDRSRLRSAVWPVLARAFALPDAALARAAGWAQEAATALDELAQMDLANAAVASGLDVVRWGGLSPARRSNALRSWLKSALGIAAPATLVTRLMDELPARTNARWSTPAGELRLYRGLLRLEPPAVDARPVREAGLRITRAGTYRLPGWGGRIAVQRVPEGGVPLAWVAHVELRARAGAERFQAGIGRPARSLKKQFQGAGVAAWDRDGPLVFSGGQLVYVPGLGLDARVLGVPGQPMVRLEWQRG